MSKILVRAVILITFPASIIWGDIRQLTLEEVLNVVASQADEMTLTELEHKAGKEEVKFYQSEAMPMVTFGTGMYYVSQSMAAQSMTLGQYSDIVGDHLNGGTVDWNLSLQQPLITFGRVFSALRIARVRDSMLTDTRKFSKDMVYLSALQAFSNAYIAQANVIVAEKSVKHSSKLLSRLELDVQSGAATKTDYMRVQALAQSHAAALLSARSQLRITIQRLCDIMELHTQDSIQLVIDSTGKYMKDISHSGTQSLESVLKAYEVKLHEDNVRYERGNLFPTINLIGSISNQYMIPDTSGMTERYRNSPFYTDGTELPFDIPKFSDYFNPDYFNYSIGVMLTWNIFDGRRTIAQYNQTKTNAEKARLEYKILQEENAAAIKEAEDIVSVLSENQTAAKLQMQASQKAYEQAIIDNEGGFIDMTTLLAIENELRQAELSVEQILAQRVLAMAQLKLSRGHPIYEATK